MARVRDALRNLTATRYTRSLEAEIDRLRAENRSLLNSILGIAGIPPLTVPAHEMASEPREGRASRIGVGSGLNAAGAARLKAMSAGTGGRRVIASSAPVRRRSWHQINQALEIDSARTKERQPANVPEIGVATKSS